MNDDNAQKRGALAETAAMYLLMFSYAVFTTIVGAILLDLLGEFSMPLTEGGFFSAALNGGAFVGVLLSGVVIDRYHKRKQIVATFFLFASFLSAIYFTTSLWAYVALLFAAGLSVKIADALLNTLVAEMHPDHKGFYINLLHCFFGIGSFLGPILAGSVVEKYQCWRLAYLILAVACFTLLGLYVFVVRGKLGSRPRHGSESRRVEPVGLRQVLSGKMGFLWLVLFLYSGHQSGIHNWLPTYSAATLGLDSLAAGTIVSVFWIGLILGRFVCSLLTRRVHERTLIIAGLGLAGLTLWIGLMAGSEFALFGAALATGFLSGGTVPMVLTIGYSWYPGAQGKVSMILFLANTLGAVVFPWIMGLIEGVLGLDAAMTSNVLMLLAPCALMLLALKPEKRVPSGPALE